jgi:hypothetical protein
VRPFRLAAFALAGPLVRFESLVAGAEWLRAALEPDLGTLTVSPFEVLPLEPERSGAVASGPPVARHRRRSAGAPAARRSAAQRGGTQARPATRTVGAAPAESETAAGAAAGPAGAGAAAAPSDAIAADASLLGTLADAAMDVVVPPSGTARSDEEPKASARPSKSLAARAGSPLGDLAAGSGAESVLAGAGAAAVAGRAAVETGAALLDELADAALAVPAGPKTAAGRPAPPGASADKAPRRRPPPPAARAADVGGGSTVADLVLRGFAGTASSPARPPSEAPGTPLLDRLAAAAIAALEPAGVAPSAQDERLALRPRSEGGRAVARALDRVQAATTAPNVAASEAVPAGNQKNGSPSLVQPSVATAPSDLAWLVNEALVEQARRHGVDLS